ADCAGFDHNAQTLRVVTALERRYAGFDGLNLSWETIEGLIKHNGPLTRPDGSPLGHYQSRGISDTVRIHAARAQITLWTFASAEAQVAAIADDIAYDAHDIDDGLRAGFFAVDDLDSVAFTRYIRAEIAAQHGPIDEVRLVHELVRRVITRMIEDVISETS